MSHSQAVIPLGRIERCIFLIRGEKVMIDADLAEFYGVQTRRLNEQVQRNKSRFPEDFMFQLNRGEFEDLKSHFATSSSGWGGRRKLPYAFTEHGAIMAASVLSSPRAVEVSVFIVRAFIKLRQTLAGTKELARQLEHLERKLAQHDRQILNIIQAVKELLSPKKVPPKRRIGFTAEGYDE
jgi:hypothetical protein